MLSQGFRELTNFQAVRSHELTHSYGAEETPCLKLESFQEKFAKVYRDQSPPLNVSTIF